MQHLKRMFYFVSIMLPILILIATSFAVSAAPNHSGGRLTEIPVVELVELGDNQPYWETTVYIKKGQLRRSTYAAIELVSVAVWEGTSSNIVVNGRDYHLPISEPLGIADIPIRGRSVIPIPIGLLHAGYNKIEFVAGPIANPTNLYDDFAVANVVIVLSR